MCADFGPGICAAPWLLPQEHLEHHGLRGRSHRVGTPVPHKESGYHEVPPLGEG